MSNPLLADMDARMHAAFLRVGLGNLCEFRPKGGAAVPNVRCYVQRGIQTIGDQGQVSSDQTLIDLIRTAELPRPVSGDRIAIGAELFAVDGAVRAADESRFQVIVKKVSA
jgi:hypothetical protein